MKNINKSKALFFLSFIFSAFVAVSQSAPAPTFSFTNYIKLSGATNAVGSVYRFTSVKTGVDAIVTISSAVNASVADLDRPQAGGGGYDAAFQPNITITKMTNGYVEFNIDFVVAGTLTPLTQSHIAVTPLDVDGYDYSSALKLFEYHQIDMGANTQMNYYQSGIDMDVKYFGNAVRGTNLKGNEYGGISLSENVRFTVYKTAVSNLKVRSGANNSDQFNNVTRQMSFYFALFNYSNPIPLAVNDLSAFSGTETKGTAQLNWQLVKGHNLSNIEVEKSIGVEAFKKIGQVNVSEGNDFSFVDIACNGDSYYRLKLIEPSGRISYSKVLKIIIETSSISSFSVYPTVISDQATVLVKSIFSGKSTLQIADMTTGRVVSRLDVVVQKGVNLFNLPQISGLKSGNYIVVYNSGNEKLTTRIIVAGR